MGGRRKAGRDKAGPAAEWVDVDRLAPWKANPRVNDHAVQAVADSIERFGFGAPIVARLADGMVIAGHTRLKAARQLGMKTVPVRYLDIDEGEAIALALVDNRVGEVADWSDGLGDVLAELAANEVDLEGLGWDAEELSMIMEGAGSVAGAEWEDALGALPSGDRGSIQTMTFTLHDDQVATVKAAIASSKALGDFGGTGNENGNGNALARICELWAGGG